MGLALAEPRQSAALIAPLLGLDGAARYDQLELSPQQQRTQTLQALVAQLSGLAERQPVLLVLEDAHWIDPTTLELLELSLAAISRERVLLLITARPGFVHQFGGHPSFNHMVLNRLGREPVTAIIERLSGGKTLPDELREEIIGKADGVPLFVEELTKTILTADFLRDAGDRYELTGPLSAVAIPTTLQDSLMARLDRLPGVHEVVQIGAVFGREFDYELLRAVAAVEEPILRENLAHLVQAELLYQSGQPPQAHYLFKHALVRDTAYESLLRSKRRQLHHAITNALENDFFETVATEPEVLAHHCEQAGLSEKAITYWLRAAKTASERSAHTEGIAHINRGLKVLPEIVDPSERKRLELELQSILAGLLLMTKGHAAPEVGETYSRVLELSEQLHDNKTGVSALFGVARFHMIAARFDKSKHYIQKLLDLARKTKDPTSLAASHYAFGVSCLQCGEVLPAHRSFAEGARFVDLPRVMPIDVANHPGIACMAYLALPLWLLGYPDRALFEAQRAVNLARNLDHPFSLIFVLVILAKLFHLRREARLAQAVAGEAIAIAKERGFPLWMPIAEAVQAWATAAYHAKKSALQIRRALADREAIKANFDRTYLLCLLSDVLASNRQNEEALEVVAEGLALADQLGERVWEAELVRHQGKILELLETGGVAEAEANFSRAVGIANAQHAKSFELRAAINLARLWGDQGKRRQAYDLLAPVYNWFTEGFDTVDMKDAKALLDELA